MNGEQLLITTGIRASPGRTPLPGRQSCAGASRQAADAAPAKKSGPARIERMESRNVFAGHYLERATYLRNNPQCFSDALEDPGSRVLLLWNLRSLITTEEAPRAASVSVSSLPAELRTEQELILLGEF